MRIKRENGSEVLIYNGINNYILQAILKELLSNALLIYFKPNIFILCAEKQICEKELMVLPSYSTRVSTRALRRCRFFILREPSRPFQTSLLGR